MHAKFEGFWRNCPIHTERFFGGGYWQSCRLKKSAGFITRPTTGLALPITGPKKHENLLVGASTPTRRFLQSIEKKVSFLQDKLRRFFLIDHEAVETGCQGSTPEGGPDFLGYFDLIEELTGLVTPFNLDSSSDGIHMTLDKT